MIFSFLYFLTSSINLALSDLKLYLNVILKFSGFRDPESGPRPSLTQTPYLQNQKAWIGQSYSEVSKLDPVFPGLSGQKSQGKFSASKLMIKVKGLRGDQPSGRVLMLTTWLFCALDDFFHFALGAVEVFVSEFAVFAAIPAHLLPFSTCHRAFTEIHAVFHGRLQF